VSILIRQGIRSRIARRIHVNEVFFSIPGLILIFGLFIGLEHATIKDNIVFGNTNLFDEARYQSVLDACALRQDLAIFDAGDMTGGYLSAMAFVLR
jgi:hypothetical protein